MSTETDEKWAQAMVAPDADYPARLRDAVRAEIRDVAREESPTARALGEIKDRIGHLEDYVMGSDPEQERESDDTCPACGAEPGVIGYDPSYLGPYHPPPCPRCEKRAAESEQGAPAPEQDADEIARIMDGESYPAPSEVTEGEVERPDIPSRYWNARTCVCGESSGTHRTETCDGFDPDWKSLRRSDEELDQTIERLQRRVRENEPGALQDDLRELMEALGISTHARPVSPHRVMHDEIIPTIQRLQQERDVLERRCKKRVGQLAEAREEIARLRESVDRLQAERNGEVWLWQGDGSDEPDSLSCPVLMHPEDLRTLLAEIARLREDLHEAKHRGDKGWAIQYTVSGARVCKGGHRNGSPCEWEEFVSADQVAKLRAEIARLRDPANWRPSVVAPGICCYVGPDHESPPVSDNAGSGASVSDSPPETQEDDDGE